MLTYYDLVLFGRETGADGIPKPFNRYRIEVAPWITRGSGVASVIPTTEDTPAPNQPHFIAVKGGPKAAAKIAREAIEALPTNKNLLKRGNCP